ncbi:MAG: OmpA family protein [Deltaproteobacteria bacterium]|nr:OmpA family protein [Deltaproteobacteria bacterium]
MARRKKSESESGAAWEMVFTCLAIILVSFFCLLNALSNKERGKIIEIARSFKGAVALLEGGLSAELGKELTLYSPDQPSKGRLAVRAEMRRSIENLQAQIKETGLEEFVSVKWSEEGVQFVLRDALLFDAGNANLKHEAYKLIDIIANSIRKSNVLAVVEGHTDDRPIHTPLYPSNWELSAMRAAEVMRFMETQFCIPASRIEARGYGEFRPIAENDTPEGRSQNRRVEIRLKSLPKGRYGEG